MRDPERNVRIGLEWASIKGLAKGIGLRTEHQLWHLHDRTSNYYAEPKTLRKGQLETVDIVDV